jgi:predicted  nucleic acid-binding Zn-ribbon protein
MSENNMAWFHCGRCGSLFQSGPEDNETRVCSECGRNPSLGVESAAPAPPAALPAARLGAAVAEEGSGRPKKRKERRRGSRFMMTKLAVGWLLVLLAIVFVANRFWKGGAEKERDWKPQAQRAITEEEANLLQEHGETCGLLLAGYLGSSTPEERNQYVLNPVTTVTAMSRFFGLNPHPVMDPGLIRHAGMSVIHLPEGEAIEGRWQTEEGHLIDAVFRRERAEWRIDWHHLVRYSDYPWPLYLAGSGDPEGDFRLLARQRLVNEDLDSESLSVVFYAPRFGYPKDHGPPSPEFDIPRDSRDGRLLAAAFKLQKDGGQSFGSLLPAINPDDMIRVRVRVRRMEVEMERRFELLEVLACHWLEIDDPGVDLSTETDQAFPEADSD